MKKNLLSNEVAEIELNYLPRISVSTLPKVSASREAAAILRSIWSNKIAYREEFWAMYLNRANRILAVYKISEGGCTGTVVDLKQIYQAALLVNAQAIILSHNHPSGNLSPSESDKVLTRNIVAAGRTLEISVLDHIIMTQDSFLSMADEGLM